MDPKLSYKIDIPLKPTALLRRPQESPKLHKFKHIDLGLVQMSPLNFLDGSANATT